MTPQIHTLLHMTGGYHIRILKYEVSYKNTFNDKYIGPNLQIHGRSILYSPKELYRNSSSNIWQESGTCISFYGIPGGFLLHEVGRS